MREKGERKTEKGERERVRERKKEREREREGERKRKSGSKKGMFHLLRPFCADTMDKWDDQKLQDVVDKKHGGKTKPKTDIVSGRILHNVLRMANYKWGCGHVIRMFWGLK